jgi:hypothetical protein
MQNGKGDSGCAARKIRAIVEAKEGFVWATDMHTMKSFFKVPNLGTRKVSAMLNSLEDVDVGCACQNGKPAQEADPIILFCVDEEHAKVLSKLTNGLQSKEEQSSEVSESVEE